LQAALFLNSKDTLLIGMLSTIMDLVKLMWLGDFSVAGALSDGDGAVQSVQKRAKITRKACQKRVFEARFTSFFGTFHRKSRGRPCAPRRVNPATKQPFRGRGVRRTTLNMFAAACGVEIRLCVLLLCSVPCCSPPR
jgi:hypothetical protein